jgi:hypothetical protein
VAALPARELWIPRDNSFDRLNAIIASRDVPRSAPRIAYRDLVGAPDLQTSGAQLLDEAARQGLDIASRVLLDRCDDDALLLLHGQLTMNPGHSSRINLK